jgi:sugar porter (SP) family MFS transporter
MKVKINVGFIFFFGALGGLLFGFDTGIISGVSPLVRDDFGLGDWQVGLITSGVLIGSTVAALSTGALSDYFGRKKLLIASAVVFVLGAIACASAVGFVTLFLARIFLGLAVGAASALVSPYLAELSPAKHRGALSALFQLMITIGILGAYAVNLVVLNIGLNQGDEWRWGVGSAFIPGLLMLVGALLIPESPRFLVKIGKADEAKKVLEHLRKNTGEDVGHELIEIKEAANQPKGTVVELFTVAGPAVLAAVGIMVFQQLVGINSVIYYTPTIFETFGFDIEDAIYVSIIVGVVNFATTVLAIFLMDKYGRKQFLYFGSVVMAIALLSLTILGIAFDPQEVAVPSIILVAVYIFAFAISWGPIAWILIGEIFPLSVRGIGASVGSAANWIGNFLVSLLFPVLLHINGNISVPFAIFGGFAVLSIFFVKFLVPETRGKTLEEIEHDLRERA